MFSRDSFGRNPEHGRPASEQGLDPRGDPKVDQKLDQLFANYRAALPDEDTFGPNFMPRLWNRIEAQRSATRRLGLWSKAWMAAAAALSLFAGTLIYLDSPAFDNSYTDELDDDNAIESVAFMEVHFVERAGSPN